MQVRGRRPAFHGRRTAPEPHSAQSEPPGWATAVHLRRAVMVPGGPVAVNDVARGAKKRAGMWKKGSRRSVCAPTATTTFETPTVGR